MRKLVTGACAAMAVIAAMLTTAAAPSGAVVPQQAESYFELGIHQGKSPKGPFVARASLYCSPGGGSHPNPRAACRALERAGGRFQNLRERSGVCPMVHAPVTVVARGLWDGTGEEFTRTYSNRCMAELHTDGVMKLR